MLLLIRRTFSKKGSGTLLENSCQSFVRKCSHLLRGGNRASLDATLPTFL